MPTGVLARAGRGGQDVRAGRHVYTKLTRDGINVRILAHRLTRDSTSEAWAVRGALAMGLGVVERLRRVLDCDEYAAAARRRSCGSGVNSVRWSPAGRRAGNTTFIGSTGEPRVVLIV